MLCWKGWVLLHCATINLWTTFARILCMARLEVAKIGTCIYLLGKSESVAITVGRLWCSDAVMLRCGSICWVSAGLYFPLFRIQLIFLTAGPAGQQWPQAKNQMRGCESTQVTAAQKHWLPIDLFMGFSFVVLIWQWKCLASWISLQAPDCSHMPMSRWTD